MATQIGKGYPIGGIPFTNTPGIAQQRGYIDSPQIRLRRFDFALDSTFETVIDVPGNFIWAIWSTVSTDSVELKFDDSDWIPWHRGNSLINFPFSRIGVRNLVATAGSTITLVVSHDPRERMILE